MKCNVLSLFNFFQYIFPHTYNGSVPLIINWFNIVFIQLVNRVSFGLLACHTKRCYNARNEELMIKRMLLKRKEKKLAISRIDRIEYKRNRSSMPEWAPILINLCVGGRLFYPFNICIRYNNKKPPKRKNFGQIKYVGRKKNSRNERCYSSSIYLNDF